MRVGLLTGGGDCAALNAALVGVGKSLLQAGVELVGIEDGMLGLIEQRSRQLQWADLHNQIKESGTLLGASNKASPLDYQGRNCVTEVANYYRQLGLDCIVALGGDGTMSLCHSLSQAGMNFIGVPKTIDNDVMHNDRSFGFDTAVSIVVEAIERLHATGKSHHRVMIVETMGRYAGWIALYAGVAGEADIILLPEYPYQLEEVARVVRAREQQHQHTLIVVAEGAHEPAGALQLRQMVSDSHDPVRLGGIGKYLEQSLAPLVQAEVRSTQLGHVQRGGPPTAYDRLLALNLGAYAARLVLQHQFGQMVCIERGSFNSVALAQVARQVRKVEEDDMTLNAALAMGISLGVAGLQLAKMTGLRQH